MMQDQFHLPLWYMILMGFIWGEYSLRNPMNLNSKFLEIAFAIYIANG